MNPEKFTVFYTDRVKIIELYQLVPTIVQKRKSVEESQKVAEPFMREIKLIYKRNEIPSKEQKQTHKKLKSDLSILENEYCESLKSWNEEMDIIIQKYKYITLKKFLTKYPLKSIGVNPSLMFAVNSKRIAELIGISIIQTLYSGEPKLVNNYPEEWLLIVYKEIDKMSTQKDYRFDIDRFKL